VSHVSASSAVLVSCPLSQVVGVRLPSSRREVRVEPPTHTDVAGDGAAFDELGFEKLRMLFERYNRKTP